MHELLHKRVHGVINQKYELGNCRAMFISRHCPVALMLVLGKPTKKHYNLFAKNGFMLIKQIIHKIT